MRLKKRGIKDQRDFSLMTTNIELCNVNSSRKWKKKIHAIKRTGNEYFIAV